MVAMPTFSASGSDAYWMQQSLTMARKAQSQGEVPVGAVVVQDQQLIGEGYNQMIASHDPTAHAEVVAIRHACQQVNNYRLPGCTLYVTLEPCLLCAGAIAHARITRVVYGAADPKRGVLNSCDQMMDKTFLHHHCYVEAGILAEDCGRILSDFFRAKRGGTQCE